jgi:plastocyanin
MGIRRLRVLTLTTMALLIGGVVTATAQARHDVDVQDDSFAPARVTVEVGDTVAWSQSGANPHSVTAADGSFDSHPLCPPDCMEQGDAHEQRFDAEGEVAYYCKVHGTADGQGMAGVVVVTAAPEPEADPAPEATEEPAAAEELAETGLPGMRLLVLTGALLLAGVLLTCQRMVAPPRHSSPS